MTLKGFLFLFAVTVAAVMVGGVVAERWVEPGFGRGIVIAALAGLVVFPSAAWAERKGWIRGAWNADKALGRAAGRKGQQSAPSQLPDPHSPPERQGEAKAGSRDLNLP